ncbi:RE1, partial [Symbiodinium pilosum]
MDAAHWTPGPGDSRNKCQFMVFVDEASRFAVAKLFRKDGGGHVTANDITSAFHEVWEPCFGLPELIRADPDGACRSKELDQHFQQLGIETDNIPADAHWKISVVERSIQWIKELMTKCAGENPQHSHEAILAQAVRTWNQREPVRGYSPFQWMLGKAPDFEDRMFIPDVHKLPAACFTTQKAGSKDPRASAVIARSDLVYFWRLQGKNRQSNGSGLRHGAYAGPARILAMETKQKDGKVTPGSSVWLIRGLRLVKASIEQLRPATERETVLHELTSTTPDLPWTTTKLAEELGPHDYDDVTKDGAPDPDQDPDITEDMEDSEPELIPDDSAAGPPAVRRGVPPEARFVEVEDDRQSLPTEHAVEVSLALPDTKKKFEQFIRDPSQFFIKSLKRKTVEVSERRMTPQERENFRGAKSVEVQKFIAAKAMEVLPPELKPDRSQALRMRWILTYKQQDDGGLKPKVRAVLLGFQDPEYANRPTFAPTMRRQRAFLQGREYQRNLTCLPVPELCEGMGLAPGSVCRLKKACYGLVEAPIEWFETVNSFLSSIGYHQLRSDPCTRIYTEGSKVISLISGHVDDFLFTGREDCATWNLLREQIQKQFEWQEWEKDNFTQCGVRVQRQPDGGFQLDQRHYVEAIPAIPISRERRRQKHEVTSNQEKSQLRALLGALSWHVGQVGFKYSAHVGLSLSEVTHSTVESLEQANKLLQAVRIDSKVPLRIHAFSDTTKLSMVSWVDASSQNRPDGSSTAGIVIGLTPSEIQEGAVTSVSPMFWRSGKIERVCRSPGAAEARAAIDAEDNLFLLRYAWAEFCGHQADLWDSEGQVRR